MEELPCQHNTSPKGTLSGEKCVDFYALTRLMGVCLSEKKNFFFFRSFRQMISMKIYIFLIFHQD